jgi:hypothetical protein
MNHETGGPPTLIDLAEAYYSPITSPAVRQHVSHILQTGHNQPSLLNQALKLVAGFEDAQCQLPGALAAAGILEQCVRVRGGNLDDASYPLLFEALWVQSSRATALTGKASFVLTLLVQLSFPRLWQKFVFVTLQQINGFGVNVVAASAAAALFNAFLASCESPERYIPRALSRQLRAAIDESVVSPLASCVQQLLCNCDALSGIGSTASPSFSSDMRLIIPALSCLQVCCACARKSNSRDTCVTLPHHHHHHLHHHHTHTPSLLLPLLLLLISM